MVICISCHKIRWDAAVWSPPESLIPLLEGMLRENGFEPDQDWGAIAAQHAAQAK